MHTDGNHISDLNTQIVPCEFNQGLWSCRWGALLSWSEKLLLYLLWLWKWRKQGFSLVLWKDLLIYSYVEDSWESKNWLWTDSSSTSRFLFLNFICKSAISVITYWGTSEWYEYFQYFQSTFKDFSHFFLSLCLGKRRISVDAMWRCPHGLAYSRQDHWDYNTGNYSCFLYDVSFTSSLRICVDESEIWRFHLMFACISPNF